MSTCPKTTGTRKHTSYSAKETTKIPTLETRQQKRCYPKPASDGSGEKPERLARARNADAWGQKKTWGDLSKGGVAYGSAGDPRLLELGQKLGGLLPLAPPAERVQHRHEGELPRDQVGHGRPHAVEHGDGLPGGGTPGEERSCKCNFLVKKKKKFLLIVRTRDARQRRSSGGVHGLHAAVQCRVTPGRIQRLANLRSADLARPFFKTREHLSVKELFNRDGERASACTDLSRPAPPCLPSDALSECEQKDQDDCD
jgi:hypothetical protein